MIDGRLFYYDHNDHDNHVVIQRVQMEQDSAKIIEKNGKWLVDYNRSGMPLLEIITEAQFTNPEDCKLVVREMQEMLSTLGVSEASIEQGSMRVDVNLSVYDTTSSDVDQNKNVGNSALTHLLRTPNIEIQNVGKSAKNVERAVEYEYRRLVALLESG